MTKYSFSVWYLVTARVAKYQRIQKGYKNGTTGYPPSKNESRHRPYILHKNELKMDGRPKCKMPNYQILITQEKTQSFGNDSLDTSKAPFMKEKKKR